MAILAHNTHFQASKAQLQKVPWKICLLDKLMETSKVFRKKLFSSQKSFSAIFEGGSKNMAIWAILGVP